jgi:hypothetical protein
MSKMKLAFEFLGKIIRNSSIKHYRLLKVCIGLVLIETVAEHILNAEFIRATSLTCFSTLQNQGSIQKSLLDILLAGSAGHLMFLYAFLILLSLYVLKIGSVWVSALCLVAEYIFQQIHVCNLYGHQGAVHQFFTLIILIDFTQFEKAKAPFKKGDWHYSLAAGLLVWLLRLQIVAVYFFSGLGKFVSPGWKNPQMLQRIFLNANNGASFLDPLFANSELAGAIAVGVLFFQLLFPSVLLNKKIRNVFLSVAFLFHLVLAIKLSIYVFSFFMVSLYLAFYSEMDGSASQNSPLNPLT